MHEHMNNNEQRKLAKVVRRDIDERLVLCQLLWVSQRRCNVFYVLAIKHPSDIRKRVSSAISLSTKYNMEADENAVSKTSLAHHYLE